MSASNNLCVECCFNMGCLLCQQLPSGVQGASVFVLSITLIVVGILGACSVIDMSPAAACFGCILPGIFLPIWGCFLCCKT